MGLPESLERLPIPHADAALIRLYWMSQEDGKDPRLSLRSYLSCVAGAMLFKEGLVDNLAVLIGNEWGPNYPAASDLAKNLLILLGVSPEKIQAYPLALDSDQETAGFLKLAKEKNYKSLIDVGFKKHSWTREHGYKKLGREPGPFVPVEAVITRLSQNNVLGPGYHNLLRELKTSKAERAYTVYEGGKFIAYSLPLVDKLMERETNKRGVAPRPVVWWFGKVFGSDMDMYFLPKKAHVAV